MKDDFFRANPIRLDPDIPLYQQLYTHLQTAVLSGDFKPGMRLPSTRALAILLNVSRHTVLNAYQQLIAEGYLDGMVGHGTFVAQIVPEHLLTSPPRKDLVEASLALEQAVLADFIVDGHFTRHLRKMRSLYAERRAALMEAAREIDLEIHPPEAGMHGIAWLPEEMDTLSLIREAAIQGVDLAPVSHFSIEPLARNGILLGYSDYSVEQIQDGMRRLAMAMDSI